MPVLVNVLDVGQGNMALIQAGAYNIVCDCNICDDNEQQVLARLGALIPIGNGKIHAFFNTHRDADHLRGIDRLDGAFPIECVADAGVPGRTTDSPEYRAYMRVRGRAVARVLRAGETIQVGPLTTIRVLHGASESRPDNCNREGVVFKLEHAQNSVLFAGDCDTATWKRIVRVFPPEVLDCSALVAPHHGAIRCLEESSADLGSALRTLGALARLPPPRTSTLGQLVGASAVRQSNGFALGASPVSVLARIAAGPAQARPTVKHYTEHLKLARPYFTVISVGRDNSYGHPSPEALRLYEEHTIGIPVSGQPTRTLKIARTDQLGSFFIALPDARCTDWTWCPGR